MVESQQDHSLTMKSLPKAFNRTLGFTCALIAISQVNFGFDQAVFTNTQAMSNFTHKFGKFNPKTNKYAIEPYFLSLLNSLNYVGFAFGLVFGSFFSRRYGRRTSMMAMCGWAIAAAIILVTAQNRNQVLAGRIIGYVYIGVELAIVPIFQSEIAPAHVRGFVVGTYQSGLLLGQLIGALVCRGTSTLDGEKAWRLPFGLLFVIPCLILCTVWSIPESPRWYLLKGRKDDAVKSLTRLRRGRFSETEINQEIEDLECILNTTIEKGRFDELFRGPNLRRTILSCGVNCFLHLTGQNFQSVYGAIFIASLGVVNPFTMTSINAAISIVVVFLTMYLADKIGRVPLMAAGSVIQIGALFAMGGLGTVGSPGVDIKRAITAMVTVFSVGFCLGWAPLSHVVAAEIPNSRLRDMTYALGSFFNIVIQFAISFSIPYLLYEPYAALGSKVGFIFGSTAVCALVFTLLCIPECKGKSLEEIDQLFIQGTPLRKFRTAVAALPSTEGDRKEGVLEAEKVEHLTK